MYDWQRNWAKPHPGTSANFGGTFAKFFMQLAEVHLLNKSLLFNAFRQVQRGLPQNSRGWDFRQLPSQEDTSPAAVAGDLDHCLDHSRLLGQPAGKLLGHLGQLGAMGDPGPRVDFPFLDKRDDPPEVVRR
jgi:hypothetical protein